MAVHRLGGCRHEWRKQTVSCPVMIQIRFCTQENWLQLCDKHVSFQCFLDFGTVDGGLWAWAKCKNCVCFISSSSLCGPKKLSFNARIFKIR